ncbi:hypothetical protein ACFODL_14855 [Phenylobacterium terrae]|uniref:Uncharacterized protein n=1 Tax=Phenylobacterium terrae TaxID=2665495 RepID=A0ABW4N0R8_9CAUL
MPYICYLYEGEGQVPYMEVLPEASLAEARGLTLDLLHQRPNYVRAELWDGEQMVSRFFQDRPRSSPNSGLGLAY